MPCQHSDKSAPSLEVYMLARGAGEAWRYGMFAPEGLRAPAPTSHSGRYALCGFPSGWSPAPVSAHCGERMLTTNPGCLFLQQRHSNTRKVLLLSWNMLMWHFALVLLPKATKNKSLSPWWLCGLDKCIEILGLTLPHYGTSWAAQNPSEPRLHGLLDKDPSPNHLGCCGVWTI